MTEKFFLSWSGSLSEAESILTQFLLGYLPEVSPPELVDLAEWHTNCLLSSPLNEPLGGRQILEAAYIARQRSHSASLLELAERMPQLSDHGLWLALTQPFRSRVAQTVTLLAQGVVAQYEVAKSGRSVGVSDSIPLALRQAQGQLARFALEDSCFDTFASVSELLHQCRQPMAAWAPRLVGEDARYANTVLIDPDFVVPSEECGTLAATASGGLANLIEQQLFGKLQQALQLLDEPERDTAYTRIRRFIAEHPMATRAEWRQVRTDPRLTPLAGFLEEVYEPAHAAQARQHVVPRCARCLGAMRLDGLCGLVSCRERPYLPRETTPIPVADALVARPEVLRYWCDPAQDELRLYRALVKARGEDQMHLYPHQDRCDVAIGETVGFDVKDYRDPVQLARRLNTSLGGLHYYPERVLVIASRRAHQPEYIPLLREQLRADLRRSVQILSVTQAIRTYNQTW